MENGFSTADWATINTVDAEGRLFAKFLQTVDYIALDGTHYRIPQYQFTDYASTPPAVWGAPLFLIPYGWWSLPTALHDAAFQNQLLVVNADGSTRLAFPGADAESACNLLLREAMNAVKPNPTLMEKAQLEAIYWGVTEGGYHSYKQDRS